MTEDTPQRTFYSRCAGLICYPEATKIVVQNGEKTIFDPHPIRFTPLGQSSPSGDKFGSFTTSNPVEIEYLEKRMKNQKDVISNEEFNRLLTPPADQISILQDQLRKIQERNALLEKLQSSGKLTPPVQAK